MGSAARELRGDVVGESGRCPPGEDVGSRTVRGAPGGRGEQRVVRRSSGLSGGAASCQEDVGPAGAAGAAAPLRENVGKNQREPGGRGASGGSGSSGAAAGERREKFYELVEAAY